MTRDLSHGETLLPDAGPLKTNFELLLEHLPADSCAARLVAAHISRGAKTSAAAMREVLQAQLAALKAVHAEPPAQ